MTSRLARLSLSGLRLAGAGLAADGRADPETIASWLYRFGAYPRGPAIERDLGLDDEPLAVLGLTRGGAPRRRLESLYEASTYRGWISFTLSGAPPQGAPACKLYVSPAPPALAGAFPLIAESFAAGAVRSFKIGRGIEGLLRPDKIVAYFDDRAHLDAVAARLAATLHGCPVQGTPFTADAGGDGLLSWGADPPDWTEGASWRSWITRRLARSLAGTDRADRVGAALDDIREAGVDPERWAPIGGRLQ